MTTELKLEKWSPQELIPYELNSKKHEKDQINKICESIKRFGWDVPIVVDSEGVIIKGHGRRLAALQLGLKEVPVLVRDDLTPDQVRAARLADNRVALSDIDTNLMRQELDSLDLSGLQGIFDDKELEFMDADLGEMNIGIFIDDIDGAVEHQRTEMESKVEAAANKRVPLSKALGFKDVQAQDQIFINRFMAQIEADTSCQGYEAFIAFMKAFCSEESVSGDL